MVARAVSRYQRVSPKKIARVLELIRGYDVPTALTRLQFLNKPTKKAVLKTLHSAVANAMAKAGKVKLDEEALFVGQAQVTPGPSMKRWRAGPRGSGLRYQHRTSHITITLETKEDKKAG